MLSVVAPAVMARPPAHSPVLLAVSIETSKFVKESSGWAEPRGLIEASPSGIKWCGWVGAFALPAICSGDR